jgi:hypothetical protein
MLLFALEACCSSEQRSEGEWLPHYFRLKIRFLKIICCLLARFTI